MNNLNTEVLVIGGGATGTGILRDLAMRGFDATLVEARDLTYGTTGRFHGLLHSGGRYVVKDTQAAQECIEENRILRKIMPHCIEDVGGFFVVTPWDEPGYVDSFLAGCKVAGIPVEEVSISRMLKEEPLLNPKISHCFRVPDGAADSFAAAHANVASAQEYGADVRTYHEVLHLLMEDSGSTSAVPGRVVGALCHDLVSDEQISIYADMVVNAAGAWVGKIGTLAGVDIAIQPGKGTMIAVSQRIVNTVINRCKMPSDGDILVPAHTVAVMGTTDEQVADPDAFAIEPWEVQLMLEEGQKIIPGFSEMRMLRAWAGVRPLYQETKSPDSRDITRSYVLLDHKKRDGVSGLITITSGKWTTYRKMAEVTVDLVCKKLATKRQCRTHLEILPTEGGKGNSRLSRTQSSTSGHHNLGHRLAKIETEQTYGQLICECELATRTDIERSITDENAKTLDDIRRDVRLGMGPCQGGFCTLRAAGILNQLSAGKSQFSVEETNVALRDFLEERWKGVLPVLWGKQLHQERFNELIYINVLNVDHLPGPRASRLATQPYLNPTALTTPPQLVEHTVSPIPSKNEILIREGKGDDVIVIGAGLSGLAAAWQASKNGLRTKVITKGWGATHWGSGCIDVLGYYPISAKKPITNPADEINNLIKENKNHPITLIGLKKLEEAVVAFQELCQTSGYPLSGSLGNNWLLPSAIGAVRPTCLAPATMLAGDLHTKEPMLLIGIEGYHDFFPHLAASNLMAQGFEARAVIIDLPSFRMRRRLDTITLAKLFDQKDFRAEFAEALKPYLGNAPRVGLPAVLGVKNPLEALRDLESSLGRRIFEIPGLPPSVPGMRLHNLLVDAIQKAGGRVENGMEVMTFSGEQIANRGHIEAVRTEAAARSISHFAKEFILATGGILGDGIKTISIGYAQESVFDLPIANCSTQGEWFQRGFFAAEGHSIFRAGIVVDRGFRPANVDGGVIYDNLSVIGSALAHSDTIRERSLEGVALGTGFAVGGRLVGI